jgi:autotransporter-associated beta strand protein
VLLGDTTLTIGTNFYGSSFAGHIEGIGGLNTLNGPLILSGASTYTGGTTIGTGVAVLTNNHGSATGTGPVTVDGGTLAGGGAVSGPITVGTGSGKQALLAPSSGSTEAATFTCESNVTFQSDGKYSCRVDTSQVKADQLVANGVTIVTGAKFALTAAGNQKLNSGTAFVIISNTSATPISGTFANLADGSIITGGKNRFQASYSGGDGNDLSLTVVD